MMKPLYLVTFLLFCLVGCGTTTPTPAPTATRPAFTVDNFEPIHASYVQEFVETQGFGVERVQVNPFFHDPQPFMVNGSPYNVTQVELISLLEHNPPGVYITADLPRKALLKDSQTRPLTAAEQDALQTLQSGENLIVTPGNKDLAMFGALRAQSSCLECHEAAKEQTLLGVFIYHLNAVVTDTTKM